MIGPACQITAENAGRIDCGLIVEAADRHDVGWREAGQAVAIARVAEAARLRSVYP